MDGDQSSAIGQHGWETGVERCPRCAVAAPLIYVHGHAQCSACGCNILDCCQGSGCDLAGRVVLPTR